MPPGLSRHNRVGRFTAVPMRASQTLTINIGYSSLSVVSIPIDDIFDFNLCRVQFIYFRLYPLLWDVNGVASPNGSLVNQSGHYCGLPSSPIMDLKTISSCFLYALRIRLGYLRFHCGGFIIVCFHITLR